MAASAIPHIVAPATAPSRSHVTMCPLCGGPRVRSATPSIQARALEALAQDLAGVPASCWSFFEHLFSCPNDVSTANQLARLLGIGPSTLASRFFRAGLPSPKRYLASARLVRAAALLEKPERSVHWVAYELHASSPQSFTRSIRIALGMSAVQFRRQYDGDRMLERFRSELVKPYGPALRRLLPSVPGHPGSPR